MNRLQKAFQVLTGRAHDVNYDGGASNIFGTIAKSSNMIPTTAGFIPADSTGGTIDLTGSNVEARWIGLDSIMMQKWAYYYCSPLAAVIDRLAEADTNGRVEFIDSDGATLKNIKKVPALYRVQKLMKNPNPLQTWSEFNNEQVVLCKQFGYCPVFFLGPAGFDKTYTKYMFNISPEFATPQANTEFDIYSEDPILSNPIKEWVISIFGVQYRIPASDVLVLKDGLTSNTAYNHLGLPKSKIAGLDYFISNICAAMEADNVLLKKKGPLGVFSHDPKPDIAGWTPMTPEDKDDVQSELRRYGLSWTQLQYVISKTPIKWNAMSFNLRDLMTKETIRMGIDGICDRFGYPAELMSGKNATYENRDSAERFLYQNNIIPFSLRRMERYCAWFGIEGMVLDYDHLPVLQEDIMKAGQAAEALSNSLKLDWEAGMISRSEYRAAKNLDTFPGDENVFYADYLKQNPDLNPNKPAQAPADGQTPGQLKPIKSGKAA